MNLINIIKDFYGMNTTEAKKYIKTISKDQKNNLIAGFKNQAVKSFYND